MYVFIIQHGDAVPAEINPERPLSDIGREQCGKLALFLKRMPFYPELILHSGKTRALETAGIVSYELGGIHMEARDCMNPGDDPATLLDEIRRIEKPVMIVGHMPFLNRLVARLLNMTGGESLVDLVNASPLVLKKSGSGYIVDTYIRNEYIKLRGTPPAG